MRFSLVVARRPVSSRAKSARKNLYQARLAADAAKSLQADFPSYQRLYCRILWFHSYATAQDVDNIVKPILDSLKQIVFKDDYQVAQCMAMRVDLSQPYQIEANEELSDLINSGVVDILYVEIGPLDSQRVRLGPIDGGEE